MKEAVWGTTRRESSLGTGLKQHAGPGSKHTLKSHSALVTIRYLESAFYKSSKPENEL